MPPACTCRVDGGMSDNILPPCTPRVLGQFSSRSSTRPAVLARLWGKLRVRLHLVRDNSFPRHPPGDLLAVPARGVPPFDGQKTKPFPSRRWSGPLRRDHSRSEGGPGLISRSRPRLFASVGHGCGRSPHGDNVPRLANCKLVRSSWPRRLGPDGTPVTATLAGTRRPRCRPVTDRWRQTPALTPLGSAGVRHGAAPRATDHPPAAI